MDNIQRWLKSLRLHKYQPLFKALTYEQMLNLDEAFLIDKQVTKGARNKILVSVRKLNMRHIRLIHLVDDINQGNLSMKEALTTLNDMLITPIPQSSGAESVAVGAGLSNAANQSTTQLLARSPPTPLSSSSSTSGFCSDSDAISVSSTGSLMSTASNDPHHLTYLFVDAFEKVAQKLIESADYEDAACHGIMATIVDECLKHNSFTKEQKARVARFRQPHTNRQYHRHPFQKRQHQQPLQQSLVRQCHHWQSPQLQLQQQQQQQQQQYLQQQRRHQSPALASHYHSWQPFRQQQQQPLLQQPHHYPYQQQQQYQPLQQLRPQQQQSTAAAAYKEYSLLSPCLTFELPCLRARISGDEYMQIVDEYYKLPAALASAAARLENGRRQYRITKTTLAAEAARYQVPIGRARQPSYELPKQQAPVARRQPIQMAALEGASPDQAQQSERKERGATRAPVLTRINRNVNPHKQSSLNPINNGHSNPQHHQLRPRAPSATNSVDQNELESGQPQGQLTVNQLQLLNQNYPNKQKSKLLAEAGAEKSTTTGDHEAGDQLSAPPSALAPSVGATAASTSAAAAAAAAASSATTTTGAKRQAAQHNLNNEDALAMASSLLANSAGPGETFAEDPLLSSAMLGSNLAESFDFVGNDLGVGGAVGVDQNGIVGSGHFDYAYQTSPAREPPQTIASASQHYPTASNNSMALYRLLNLIDQTSSRPQVPPHLTQPHIPMPFQISKISSPYSPSGAGDGAAVAAASLVRLPSAAAQSNFDNYNDYHHYHTLTPAGNNKSLFNGNQLFSNNFTSAPTYQAAYPFSTSQLHHRQRPATAPSFMPNQWSRKRNQVHWRQQQQQQADLNQSNGFSAGPSGRQSDGLFVDQYLIEVQPTAMKTIKPPSAPAYLNTSLRRNSSAFHGQGHAYHNHQHEPRGGHDGGHHNFTTGNPHSSAPSAASTSSNRNNLANLNNDNFNSLLNNDDVGFGNKHPRPQQAPHSAQPPNNSFGLQQQPALGGGGGGGEKLSGALTSSSLANLKVPHDADSEIIGANNAPRCDKFTPDICVDDFEYPEQAIIDEIQKKRDVFELMYSEVKDNEPLVDGIPRDVEESYNYDYYYYGKANLSQASSQASAAQAPAPAAGQRLNPLPSASSNKLHRSVGAVDANASAAALAAATTLTSDTLDAGGSLAARASAPSIVAAAGVDGMDALIGTMPQATNSQAAQSPPTTGYICPSEVMYGKPKLAKNKKGLWKVIVNAGEFTQTVRLEKCLFPNKKCNYVSAQSYESRCAQVHSYNRLLVFEKGRGFYIDTFRLPTGCNCYVSKKPFASASASGSGVSSASSRRESTSAQDSSSGGSGNQNDFPPTRSNSAGMAHGRLPALLGDSSPSMNNNNGGGQRDPVPSAPQRGPSSESMLSQTLWSILSGGGAGSSSGSSHAQQFNSNAQQPTSNAQQPYEPTASSDSQGGRGGKFDSASPQNTWSDGQPPSAAQPSEQRPGGSREAYQSQSLILEHLSQNPSLAANISDSVLRQLIDVGQISGGGGGPRSSSLGSHQANSGHYTGSDQHAQPPSHEQPHHYHHQHQPYQGYHNRPPPYRR